MGRDIVGLLVVAGLGAWGGWELCTRYGWAAREIVRYQVEIATKNKKIADLNSALERERAAEAARAAEEDRTFSDALPGLGKCILTKEQTTALNKIGGE